MDGFTSKGLVILPPVKSYRSISQTERERFDETLRLLPLIFESNYGIKLFYFNSNVIQGLTMPESMESIYCFCRGDVNYLNAVNKDNEYYAFVCNADEQFKQDEYSALRQKVQKELPFGRGISEKQRTDIIETRELTLARYIANKFELVITFENKGYPRYEFKTIRADARILIEADLLTMTAKGWHSGEPINIVTLMNRSWAYKTVNEWEAANNDSNK